MTLNEANFEARDTMLTCGECGFPEAQHADSGLCEPQECADVRNRIVDMIDGHIERYERAIAAAPQTAEAVPDHRRWATSRNVLRMLRDEITRKGSVHVSRV